MGMADGKKQTKPPQTQAQQPGRESEMTPRPQSDKPSHRGSGKLEGRVGIITGGDSGIGRAVAVAFAKEGADVVIGYLNEYEDAKETVRLVEQESRRAKAIAGDIGDESYARRLVDETIRDFGKLDIVVNNAAEQHDQEDFEKITAEQLHRTFRTNIFGMFYLTRAALPHLSKGGAIVNTTSAACATARGESAHFIPRAISHSAFARVRL